MGNCAPNPPPRGPANAVVFTSTEPPPRPAPAPAAAPVPAPVPKSPPQPPAVHTFAPGHHKLRIQIVRGRGFPAPTDGKKPRRDPYCSFVLRSENANHQLEQLSYQTHYQTHYVPQTSSPVWNTTFIVECNVPQDSLELCIFDYDRDHNDVPLGGFLLSLATAEAGPRWYQLQDVASGEVLISIAEVGSAEDYEVRATGYRVHHATLAQLQPQQKQSYAVYEVDVPPSDVERRFGKQRQFHNEAYDKAIDIFSSDPQAAVNRKAVEAEHEILFRDGVYSVESGCIESGSDFLSLLQHSRPDGHPRFFSYVLLDDKFHFAESAGKFFHEQMSKHAVLSGAREAVRFAGEFHIRQQPNPNNAPGTSPVIVFDNNSGTYAPDPALLPSLASLFQDICLGLGAIVLEHSDPNLIQTRLAAEGSAPTWKYSRKKDLPKVEPHDLPVLVVQSPQVSLASSSRVLPLQSPSRIYTSSTIPASPSMIFASSTLASSSPAVRREFVASSGHISPRQFESHPVSYVNFPATASATSFVSHPVESVISRRVLDSSLLSPAPERIVEYSPRFVSESPRFVSESPRFVSESPRFISESPRFVSESPRYVLSNR